MNGSSFMGFSYVAAQGPVLLKRPAFLFCCKLDFPEI